MRKPDRYAATLAVAYLLVAGGWVGASSTWLAETSTSVEELGQAELWKGLGFVAATAIGLFLLGAALFRRLARSHESLLRGQQGLLVAEHRATAGLMASTVAHDFNNLLTVLAGRVELLKLAPDAARRDPAVSESIESMAEACQRGIELSRQLSQVGRDTALGGITRVDLRAAVEESVNLVRKHPALLRATVSVDGDADAPVLLEAYPALLRQMVINLVLNAAEAAGDEGRVRLRVRAVPGGAALDVEDSGPGVPADLQERIFEPLFTTRERGTGLGLVSVRATAEVHGGEVTVDRSELGGAHFRVLLRAPRNAG